MEKNNGKKLKTKKKWKITDSSRETVESVNQYGLIEVP